MHDTGSVVTLLSAAFVLGTLTACAPSRSIDPDPANALSCAAQVNAAPVSRTIGEAGGFLTTGGHEFIIPGKALQAPLPFVMSVLPAPRVGVDLSSTPPAHAFGREATVSISVAHCTAEELAASSNWSIARFEDNGPGVKLTTRRDGDRFWAYTKGNSYYVIVAD